MLPRDALGIDYPVLLALGVAAGRLALVDRGHFGLFGTLTQLGELLCRIGLEAQVVQAGLVTTGGDSEIHPGIFEHPLGVIRLDSGRLGAKQVGIERDTCLKIAHMNVNVKAFHTDFLSTCR